MEGAGRDPQGAGRLLTSVDDLLRGQGLVPDDLVRSLLAAAAEQRMRERNEPFPVAVQRALAALVASARVRR